MAVRAKEAIKKDLVDELYWDYRVDASDVKVEVSESEVKLTGTVPSYTARQAAASSAWQIEGVSKVNNQLDVNYPSKINLPSDEEIKNNAERTLAWNTDVYSIDIDVSVKAGVVSLDGTVDAYWKRWKAEDLVSSLRGVIDVENHLAVVPEGDFLDKDIAVEIEDALKRNLYVDAEDITVELEEGRVTLTGTVPSNFVRNKALIAASYTPGVLAVDNNLIVV